MKKPLLILAVLMTAVVLFSACSSTPKVERMDSSEVIDLSGRWNDADARLVSDSLINDFLAAPRVSEFIRQYASQHNGTPPACLVWEFSNDTSEHDVNTSIISTIMETVIVNSGKLDIVVGGELRDRIRSERQDQQSYASPETAVAVGKESGAALVLTGSVKSMMDRAGIRSVKSYFVSAALTNVENNTRLWMGDNNEIKKLITQSNFRP